MTDKRCQAQSRHFSFPGARSSVDEHTRLRACLNDCTRSLESSGSSGEFARAILSTNNDTPLSRVVRLHWIIRAGDLLRRVSGHGQRVGLERPRIEIDRTVLHSPELFPVHHSRAALRSTQRSLDLLYDPARPSNRDCNRAQESPSFWRRLATFTRCFGHQTDQVARRRERLKAPKVFS